MNELLKELNEERAALEQARLKRQLLEMRLKASPAYQLITDDVDYHSARVCELTEEITDQALQWYRATRDKRVAPGVAIKEFTRIHYDLTAALDWARKNLPEALSLNEKFFEAHAKGVAHTQPIPGVEIVEEPRAQIASDLSKYLPKENQS